MVGGRLGGEHVRAVVKVGEGVLPCEVRGDLELEVDMAGNFLGGASTFGVATELMDVGA
jgi:hypothetical protein